MGFRGWFKRAKLRLTKDKSSSGLKAWDTQTVHTTRDTEAKTVERLIGNWMERTASSVSAKQSTSPLEPPQHLVTIEAMSLAGKSTFLKKDVKKMLAPKKPDLTYVYCDYDEFIRAPSKIEVLIQIQSQLIEAGFKTYWLNACLHEYLSRQECPDAFKNVKKHIKGFEQSCNVGINTVGAATVMAGGVTAATAGSVDPKATISATLLHMILAAVNAAWVVELVESESNRSKAVKQFIEKAELNELYDCMELMLLADIQQERQSGRYCVIALDEVNRSYASHGPGCPLWEFNIARSHEVFTILSYSESVDSFARLGSLENLPTYESVFNESDEQLVASYLQECRVKDAVVCKDIQAISKGIIGIARLCVDAVTEAESSRALLSGLKSSIDKDLDSDMKGTQRIARQVLHHQIRYLSDGKVQALYNMAWLGRVAPIWMLDTIPSLGAHSRALYRLGNLSFVESETCAEWGLHSAIAYCLMLDCDELTVAYLQSILERKLTEKPSLGFEQKATILQALIRIDAQKLYKSLGKSTHSQLFGFFLLDVFESADNLKKIRKLVDAVVSELDANDEDETDVNAMTKEEADKPEICYQFSNLLKRLSQYNNTIMRKVDTERALSMSEAIVDSARKLLDLTCDLRSSSNSSEESTAAVARECKNNLSNYLVRLGAIESDQYRNTSDITHHLSALAHEIEALQFKRQLKDNHDINGYVNNLNSIAVSCYRLKLYEISLPIHTLMKKQYVDKGLVEEGSGARFMRTFAATAYAYVKDSVQCGADVVDWDPDEQDTKSSNPIETALKRAISYTRKAIELRPNEAWDPSITQAECLEALGELEKAETLLKDTRENIVEKVGNEDTRAARCSHILARCMSFPVVLVEHDEICSDSNKLKEALTYCEEALCTRVNLLPDSHVDVRKSVQLKERIQAELTFNTDRAAPSTLEENDQIPQIWKPTNMVNGLVRKDKEAMDNLLRMAGVLESDSNPTSSEESQPTRQASFSGWPL